MDTLTSIDIANMQYYSRRQFAEDITYFIFGLYHLGKYAYKRIRYGSSKDYKLFNHCEHLGIRPLYKEQGGVCAKCTRMCCTKCIEHISDDIDKKTNCYLALCNQCSNTEQERNSLLLR
jgi:hypothetical protein